MAQTIRGAVGARLLMQVVIAAAAVWWLLYWFLQPITRTEAWEEMIDNKVMSHFQGMSGSIFLLQVLPVIVIAFLSYFVLELRRRLIKPSAKMQAEGEKPRMDIWTLPIIVKSPLGMLTLGDLFFLLLTLFVVLWYFIKFTVKFCSEIDHTPLEEGDPPRWVQKIGTIGVMSGCAAVIPIALLWIPVSRGSPILQVIGVPFERAVKYHTWLGYLVLLLLVAHGGLLTGYYIHEHETRELITWSAHGTSISVVAGVVALAAGIAMMLTALEPVRRRFFDLFFATHHLYLVFLIFFAFHCVDWVMYVIVPVLVFFLDRFMRAMQSRKAVDVLSAKVQQAGIIELKFAKAANSTYHALSFVYVLLPSVSRLHWHPFSVASSPLDETNEIAIYIKPLGGFTKSLHNLLLSTKSSNPGRDFYKCPFSSKVGLEGPYGDESAFYLRYKNLVMVAGGIGVTPFLAILRDILHRCTLHQEDLPSFVHLIFCVRNVSELHILDALAPSSILPNYAEHLMIKVDAYVTTISASSQDDIILPTGEETSYTDTYEPQSYLEIDYKSFAESPREMSTISSSGHSIWVAATFASTIVGFFVINGLFNVTALEKHDLPNYDRVFIYITTVIIAVLFFGGVVMLLWALVEKRAPKDLRVTSQSSMARSPDHDKNKDIESSTMPTDESLWKENVTYGRRPVWKDVFSNLATKHEGQGVGVRVSGASKMQEDVASECRHYSLSRASTVVMHYHSVSFEL